MGNTRQLPALAIAILLCITVFQSAATAAHVDFCNGLGVPRGFLDFTVNSMFSVRTGIMPWTSLQLMLHTSFVARRDDLGGGSLSLWANSGYVLTRVDFPQIRSKLTPYLALGYGQHLMYSFASSSSLVSKNTTTWAGKGHAFFGFDVSLKPRFYLSLYGRLTVPSDILIDSGYLTLGYRIK
jgi:hypothetical protein